MSSQNFKLVNTTLAFGATTLAALNAHAVPESISSNTNLNLSSTDDNSYVVVSFNTNSFAITGTVGSSPISAFQIAAASGYDVGKGANTYGNLIKGGSVSFRQLTSTPITLGATINASSTWVNSVNFDIIPDSYYGIRFNLGSGRYDYGWIQLNSPDDITVNVLGVAVETIPNTFIYAGEVPEPSTLALLALAGGSVALIARRNSRRATVTR